MKQLKRAAYLFCAVMFLLIMAGQVFASETVNPDKDVTLTITSIWDQKSIPGMEYKLYLVSTFDENGKLTPSAEFRTYAQKLDIKGKNDEAWHTLAQELDDAFIAGKISAQPADAVTSNENGITKFPSRGKTLVKGLYLVLSTCVEYDGFVYVTSPFFVSLPWADTDGQNWDYDVDMQIAPKIARKPLREDLKVIKIWDDKGNNTKRPKTITIRLKRDGVEYDVITLPQNNRWEYTWKDLETKYHWTVTEDKVEGYKDPSITREGNTFKVVNTVKPGPTPPPTPTLPQTGQLWWPVPILISIGLLLMVLGVIRRKEAMYNA